MRSRRQGNERYSRTRLTHGMPTTQAETINADILAFLKS
jgi:hypothetical protein